MNVRFRVPDALAPGPSGRRRLRAAVSCSFDRDQFIFDVVHLNQSRARRGIVEMHGNSFEHLVTELIPGFSFGKNAVTQSPCVEATFLGVAISKISSMRLGYRTASHGHDAWTACDTNGAAASYDKVRQEGRSIMKFGHKL